MVKKYGFQDIVVEAIQYLGPDVNQLDCLLFAYSNSPVGFLSNLMVPVCEIGDWIVKVNGKIEIVSKDVFESVFGEKGLSDAIPIE